MPEESDSTQNQTPQPVNAQVPQEPVSSVPPNPEMAAVQANQPTAKKQSEAPKPVKTGAMPPKKIGREKLEKSKRKFILGCIGGFIFLFVLFIILMVLMISRSGASNPVMQAFGLDPGGVRNFLQGVVGFSFGMLSLLFLVLLIIGLFKFLGAQKSDKEKRSRNLRMTIINSVSLVLMVGIWVVLANYIGQIEISAERVIAEIVVLEPDDLSDLTAPVEIRFSANNVALALQQAGAQIQSMSWDLDGDGIYETPVREPEITHLYNQRGTYNVGLEVTLAGENGETATEVYTSIIPIETAVFEATPSSGTAPQVVEFDASNIVVRENVSSLDWDFDGDGIYELTGPDNMRPRYTFDQIGTYEVHLRVIDKGNNVNNYYRDFEIVLSDTPILSAKIDASPGLEGSVPLQVRFDASASRSLKGTITKYQWDFGDGSQLQSGQSTSHIFDEAGFYTVKLTVTDSLANEADMSVEVEVTSSSSIPEAVIGTDPVAPTEEESLLSGVLPFKVEFDASDSQDADDDIVIYEWDFDNDGTVDQEGKTVTYTFENAGTYTVRLRVEDSQQQSGETTMQILVEEPGVMSVITATPEEGTAPLTVQFDGSSSSAYEGNIVSYEWDFGDGTPKTITGAIVSHKYTVIGTYDVKLKVLTNNNESASSNKLIYVREVPLKACFVPSRSNGLAPLTVSFDSKCSTGAVSSYQWRYGDGEESTSKSPTHTFEFPGVYTVNLEVADSKNNVSTYEEIIVAEGDVQ